MFVMRDLARLFLALTALALTSGCVSLPPTPPYRRVDTQSPAYREALGREIEAQLATGRSAAEAAQMAERRVTTSFVAAEKRRRIDSVAPLTDALTALGRPRGCWAYTATIRTTRDGHTTTTIERFDPYQPEERLWTLMSIDGVTPNDHTQGNYRRTKLRVWKKQQARKLKRQRSPAEHTRASALYAEMETESTAGAITYRFVREGFQVPLAGEFPRQRETYVVDTTSNTVVRHESVALGPAKMLGGSITLEAFAQSTRYQVIDPAVPPFPITTTAMSRLRLVGGKVREELVEETYSDYRRVKCYDDRFQAIPGELRAMDIVPDGE